MSLYHVTGESNIKFMRIKEMITNFKMYGELYGEYTY